MGDLKISALGAAAALGGAEAIPAVQAGANVRLTPAQLAAYGGGGRGYAGPGDPGAANDNAAGYAAGSSWLNTGTGVRWTCLDPSAGAAIWGAGGAAHPGYVPGNFYPAHHGWTVQQTATADTLVACPIRIAERVTLGGLGVRVSTGAASTAVKLALYANARADGAPGALIAAGAGSAATTVSNADAVCSFAAAVTVAPGVYWIASLFNGAPAITCYDSHECFVASGLGANTMGVAANAAGLVVGVTGSGTFAGGFGASFGASSRRSGGLYSPVGCIKIA